MKLAVISDIHGNLPALEAVLDDIESWGCDELVVNGDLLNRGPDSLACLELVWDRFGAARFVMGNHEEYVLACADENHDSDPILREMHSFTHRTYDQMGPALSEVDVWPYHFDLTDSQGGEVHITHGSLLGTRDGIHTALNEQELAERVGDSSQLFIASHTHIPLIVDLKGTQVVNVGSVGAPFDGDPRASYGRFAFDGSRWQCEIVRVEYDKRRAEENFRSSGLLEEGGPLAPLLFEELLRATNLLTPFNKRYHDRILAGELTTGQAVSEYLNELSPARQAVK